MPTPNGSSRSINSSINSSVGSGQVGEGLEVMYQVLSGSDLWVSHKLRDHEHQIGGV
jgi:hypothetical protein